VILGSFFRPGADLRILYDARIPFFRFGCCVDRGWSSLTPSSKTETNGAVRSPDCTSNHSTRQRGRCRSTEPTKEGQVVDRCGNDSSSAPSNRSEHHQDHGQLRDNGFPVTTLLTPALGPSPTPAARARPFAPRKAPQAPFVPHSADAGTHFSFWSPSP